MANNGTITVTFLHPRDGGELQAEVGAKTTGTQALEGLVTSRFLEAATAANAYALQHQRTGKSLPLSSPIVAAGLKDGDIVAITETSAGAAR